MKAQIVAWADRVVLSDGWQRVLIAVVAGAIGALALPPLGLTPALWFSLPVAVWLIDGTTAAPSRFSLRVLSAAARDGWWFGFGFFLAGFWWIGAAFLVETDEFAWAMPLGVLGLPAGLGLFFGLAFAIARAFWAPGAWRIFALALGFGAAEYVRQFALTGFPWNTYGQAFAAWGPLAQAASLIGADGLTLVAVVIFALPATIADDRRGRMRPTWLGIAVLAAVFAFGTVRLSLSGGVRATMQDIETEPGVRFRLVQPNMSQREKIAEQDGLAVLSRLLQQSDRAAGPGATGMSDATHIIWPESPFPFLLVNEPRALAEIGKALPQKTVLFTGAVRREDGPGRTERYYNSLHAFADKGQLVATYDKMHLVPFGEYLPLESWLTRIGLRRFVHAPGAFTLGASRPLMQVPGLPPVLPLICYEVIFPYEIEMGSPRPGLILNVTNDAWFGQTVGPYQHFGQARLRAIEFGLPVVRVANTGISAVIDPYGRAHGVIGLGVEGISDIGLPKALAFTYYSDHRGILSQSALAIIFLIALGGTFVTSWRRKRAAGQSMARSGEPRQ